jgi:tetratricopeptide (TPR) repeat protein
MGGGLSTGILGDVTNNIQALKHCGDHHFNMKQYDVALEIYSLAIERSSSLQDITYRLVAALYSNRSSTYVALGRYSEALSDAITTVELDPQWSEGYVRAANALIPIPERLNEAIANIDKGIALVGADDSLQLRQLSDLRASILRGGSYVFKGTGCCYTWGSGSYGQVFVLVLILILCHQMIHLLHLSLATGN